MPELSLGVSACLLGRPVRYDGGHKRDSFVVDGLGAHAALVPVCPEVELGLGTPRETLRLVHAPAGLRLIMANGHDYTNAMRAFAADRLTRLAAADLDGFVLKRNSPSCGIEGVPVHTGDSTTPNGRGLFAEAIARRWPDMPIAEEQQLADLERRRHFLTRVCAYHAVKRVFRPRWTMRQVVAFHTARGLTLLAHDKRRARSLGRLVARGRTIDRGAFRDAYVQSFMNIMTVTPTRATHTDALMRAVAYLRGQIGRPDRNQLLAAIEAYCADRTPLTAPRELLRATASRYHVDDLAEQTYLRDRSFERSFPDI